MKKITVLLISFLSSFYTFAHSDTLIVDIPCPDACYAYIYNIIDGDTYKVKVNLSSGIFYDTDIRLYGVNTPEKNTPEGLDTKYCLQELVGNNKIIKIVFLKNRKGQEQKDKYGRTLAKCFLILDKKNEIDLANWLIQNNYGTPYFGGKK